MSRITAVLVMVLLAALPVLGVLLWTRSATFEPPRLEAALVTSPAPPPWSGRTATGKMVEVNPASFPLNEGPAQFEIRLDGADATSRISVDLVSPTMPMHGITRYDAARTTAGVYLVQLDLPMEGHWSLYVNVNDDSDPAVVDFLVDAAVTGLTEVRRTEPRARHRH